MTSFVDSVVLNFKMQDDFVPMEGFEEIAFDKFGLFVDDYRIAMSDKDS